MKKFINDNLWWMVIIAIALGGFAVYKIMAKKEETESVTLSATDVTPAE